MDSLSLTSLDKPAAFTIARISMSRVVACSRHLHQGRLIPSVMLSMSGLFRKNLPATNSIASVRVIPIREVRLTSAGSQAWGESCVEGSWTDASAKIWLMPRSMAAVAPQMKNFPQGAE